MQLQKASIIVDYGIQMPDYIEDILDHLLAKLYLKYFDTLHRYYYSSEKA